MGWSVTTDSLHRRIPRTLSSHLDYLPTVARSVPANFSLVQTDRDHPLGSTRRQGSGASSSREIELQVIWQLFLLCQRLLSYRHGLQRIAVEAKGGSLLALTKADAWYANSRPDPNPRVVRARQPPAPCSSHSNPLPCKSHGTGELASSQQWLNWLTPATARCIDSDSLSSLHVPL